MFADIVGFTAWSSMREPAQVFTLLETLYSAFDELANELGVFKVETIGDCYVCYILPCSARVMLIVYSFALALKFLLDNLTLTSLFEYVLLITLMLSYQVAVTGLPDPREDHAVVMAIFARECMKKMQVLAKELEVKLGPDTGDLSMRFGLHSGPVTAGVLRGGKCNSMA